MNRRRHVPHLFSAYIDGDLSPARTRAVETHLAACPACARELEQWRAVKTAASDAIARGGGTITHHHAIGRDHAPWMAQEVGELGLGARLSMKQGCETNPFGPAGPGGRRMA